jgi:hypothetical protein
MVKPIAPASDIIAEMQAITRAAAEPVGPGDSVKGQITRASRRLGLGPRRAETFWYGHRARILAEEADRLRQAMTRLRAERRARLAHELRSLGADGD